MLCDILLATVLANPVPYLVVTRGNVLVTTPTGSTLVIPEGSEFNINQARYILDPKVLELDNVSIFKDGFES